MASRSYNVSFNITGALDGSLLSALRNASNAMRGLGNSARAAAASTKNFPSGLNGLSQSLKQIQTAANKFRELKRAAEESKQALSAAQGNTNQLAAQFNRDKAAAEQLRQKLAQLQSEMSKAQTIKTADKSNLNALQAQLRALKAAYAEAKKLGDKDKMSSLSAAMSASSTALQAQQAKMRAAAQFYKELAEQIKKTKAELKSAETSAGQSGKGFESAKAQAASLKATLQNQLAALQQLRSQLGSAGFSTAGFVNSERQLQSEIDRVNAALQRQQALLQARQGVNQSATNLAVAGAGMMGAVYTAEQIAAPFQSAAETAIDFEHAMSRVKALTQSQNIREGNLTQVEAEMRLLTQQARDLGATTMFTSKQAADAMSYLGMAGWKTQQIYATMPGMLDLAAAAGADLAQTADIVSDNMTAMGVPVDKAAHFMDVYAYALTNSNARLSDFGETMKYAAPVAKSYGATLDETAAMVMMMANAGIKGSMAGTSLRMGLLRLAGPPKTATKEMAKLGLSLSDAQAGALEAEAVIKGLGIDLTGASTAGDKMTRVLMQLHEKTKGLSQDEKLSAFKGIFGVNAETGWLALFDQGPEVFMKYLSGLRGADGYAAQVAETMNDDTRGALIRLESAWDALKERIGGALTPAIKSVADAFTPLISSAAEWVKANPQVVQAAAGIAAALATIVVGAAAVKLAFAGWRFITSAVLMVQEALASLGSSALLSGLIGRVAALRTALFGLGGAATLGGWGAMFGAISTRAAAAATAIRTFFASLTLGSMASGAASAISSIGTAIMGAARAAFAFAFSPVGVALMAIALAGMYCYQNWSTVGPVLRQIAGIVTGSLGPAFMQIKTAIESFSSSGGFSALSAAASQLASVVGGTLVQAFAVLLTIAASAISGVIKLLADLVTVITTVGTGISEAFAKIKDGDFSGAFSSLKDAGSKALEDIKTLGLNVVNSVEQGANNVSSVINALRSKMPSGDAVRRHAVNFDANGVAHSTPEVPAPAQVPAPAATPQTPPIDATQAQANLDALGASAQTATTNLDGVQQATQGITQAGEALTQLPASVQPVTESLTQLPASVQPATTGLQEVGTNAQAASTSSQALATNAQAASASVQALGTAAEGAQGGITALGTAADGACAGTSALGTSASGAAGAVSGLGAAAQAACAQLAAAGANAAARVAAAAAAVPVKSNYAGGIYPRGEFLTTFAEKSPEAAIPLDGSQRAKDLWTQAGQMLGMLPRTEPITFTTPPEDEQGNLTGIKIPEYNQLKANDSIAVRKSKQKAQREQWRKESMSRYGGDGRNGLIVPQMMPPIIPPQTNSGGLIGDLLGRIFERPQSSAANQSSINVTFNVTINGNANKEEVQRGIEGALPRVEEWARQLEAHKHERARRSFA